MDLWTRSYSLSSATNLILFEKGIELPRSATSAADVFRRAEKLRNAVGGKDRLGRISKQGDPYIRRLLVVPPSASFTEASPEDRWEARRRLLQIAAGATMIVMGSRPPWGDRTSPDCQKNLLTWTPRRQARARLSTVWSLACWIKPQSGRKTKMTVAASHAPASCHSRPRLWSRSPH